MVDSDENNIVSHNSNIFPIAKQQNGILQRINTSSQIQTTSKVISADETKLNDISLDSRSSHCSYNCQSVVGDGNCYIF